jgi:hypothetical protein
MTKRHSLEYVRDKSRLILACTAVALTASTLSGCATYQKAQQMNDGNSSPAQLGDQQTIDLIDSLRPKGSFEAAHDNLTAIARAVAEKINQAVPGGKPWTVNTTSQIVTNARNGLPCGNDLSAGTAGKPEADPVQFDAFTPSEFKIAVNVIRQEAAKLGATEESSLFDDASKREYFVSGNDYRFNIFQINSAIFSISGDCHLLQKVIDLPPGKLP